MNKKKLNIWQSIFNPTQNLHEENDRLKRNLIYKNGNPDVTPGSFARMFMLQPCSFKIKYFLERSFQLSFLNAFLCTAVRF